MYRGKHGRNGLNARPVKAEIIEKVTYLTPNEHEAVIIFGEGHSFEEMMRRYPEKLVITQGSRGVSTCSKDGEILLVPARKAKVVDTTGAGDTLNLSLIHIYPPLATCRKTLNSNGILAQLGEHLPYKQRVIGSSPIGPILLQKKKRTEMAR